MHPSKIAEIQPHFLFLLVRELARIHNWRTLLVDFGIQFPSRYFQIINKTIAIRGKDQGILGDSLRLAIAMIDQSFVPNSRIIKPKNIAFSQIGILKPTQNGLV